VGECFFWYRPTRVVPDQRPLTVVVVVVVPCLLVQFGVIFCLMLFTFAFSALTLLVGHPACRVVGCWHGCLSGARCRLAYSPADVTATHCLLLH